MTSLPAWIPVTIAAALFQAWRTAIQARLRHELSASGAAFVRYFYALPLDVLMLAIAWWWFSVQGHGVGIEPKWSVAFLLYCLAGGVAQIFGTLFLILAFGHRNYLVGTAYAKTEAVQLVLLSVLVFGIALPGWAVLGVLVSMVGVLWLSLPVEKFTLIGWLKLSIQPAALYGLGAGFAFALTALALREASLTLDDQTPVLLKALLVLLITNALQVGVQGSYMAGFARQDLRQCLIAWRRALPVGMLSAIGSAAWFTGFSLTQVALVRGLGQVEVLFTLLFSHFYLHERFTRREVLALGLVAAGVVMIALSEQSN
ncbi:EamA family transporter [Halothiobacillus sp. DCM-1]|uniref:EamA family transporter n=1 Tax=Halothiobacillus sp. DCM-1 TaxID=3112558 RepID=UPI0032487840